MILIKLFHVTFKAFFTLASSGVVKSLYVGIKMLFRKLINHGWNINNNDKINLWEPLKTLNFQQILFYLLIYFHSLVETK